MFNKTEHASQSELQCRGALSYLKDFYILKSLQKIAQNINHPAKSDNCVLKVGIPVAMHKQANKDVEKVVNFDSFYSLSFCLQHTENSRLMLAQFVTAIKMLWQELGLTFRNFAPICFKRSSRLSDKL